MEDNVLQLLDEQIESLFEKMRGLDPQTEEYVNIRDSIVSLYKMRIDEERIIAEQKIAEKQAKKESRAETAKTVLQVACTVLTVGVTAWTTWAQVNGSNTMMENLLKFEEEGTVGSKALAFVPKINFRNK